MEKMIIIMYKSPPFISCLTSCSFFPHDADKRKFRMIRVIHPILPTVESGNNLAVTELWIDWSAGRVI